MQEFETDNTGRKLGPKKYVRMFQAAYPNAGMTMENTMQALRARFPLEVRPRLPTRTPSGRRATRSRVHL